MAKPGRPKKVAVEAPPVKAEGNFTAEQIKMLSSDATEPVKAAKKKVVEESAKLQITEVPQIWLPEPSEKRKFIRDLAVQAFLELIKHNGKVNNDWSDIVTRESKALADKLDF